VGDGAVIGAHSIVTKNVPPCAIVAGNPAKIIRMRFSEQIISLILQLRWWDLEASEISSFRKILNQNPDEQALRDLIKKYR
jgi:virginiamycin A acetyltransferase